MKAIMVVGVENSGKTAIILRIRDLLLEDGYNIVEKYKCGGEIRDISVLLQKSDIHRVLVHSATDDKKRIKDLNNGIQNCIDNLDLIVTACRRGKKKKRIKLRNMVFDVLGDYGIKEEDVIEYDINNMNSDIDDAVCMIRSKIQDLLSHS